MPDATNWSNRDSLQSSPTRSDQTAFTDSVTNGSNGSWYLSAYSARLSQVRALIVSTGPGSSELDFACGRASN